LGSGVRDVMEIYDDVVIYPYIIEMDVTHSYYTLY
jgi:hypothetical protein